MQLRVQLRQRSTRLYRLIGYFLKKQKQQKLFRLRTFPKAQRDHITHFPLPCEPGEIIVQAVLQLQRTRF
eukprot:SAG31_NODE_13_length_37961_cov_21.751307_8_plen_70_part_00